jgi:hypothetical protein
MSSDPPPALPSQEEKEFIVLRYSLIEEPQGDFSSNPLPAPKGKAVLEAIKEDREFTFKKTRYSFVGFASASPSSDNNDILRFCTGKFAKLKKAHMGKKAPGDIVDTEEDDWLALITVFDMKNQYIFVAKNTRFGTPELTARALQAGLREPILAKYNHSIFVEGKTRSESFWKVIRGHNRIYNLKLQLISPNILETNLLAREALAALKELFMQDKVDITLKSETGQIKVPEEPTSSYLEYIEQGEGSWNVTTEGANGGKKNHTSSEHIETAPFLLASESMRESSTQMRLEPAENARAADTASNISLVDQVISEVERYREH